MQDWPSILIALILTIHLMLWLRINTGSKDRNEYYLKKIFP